MGCSVLRCPSSLPWEGKSSPQSSQVKVLSVCVMCWLVMWLCKTPGERKAMEQYKQRNRWEPAGAALSEPGLGQPRASLRAQGAAVARTHTAETQQELACASVPSLGCTTGYQTVHGCSGSFWLPAALALRSPAGLPAAVAVPAHRNPFSLFPHTIQHCSLLA